MTDKHTQDIETLIKEIQQLKFELKAADASYSIEIEEKDKVIAELKTLLGELLSVTDGIPYSEMFTNDEKVCEKVRKLLNESE